MLAEHEGDNRKKQKQRERFKKSEYQFWSLLGGVLTTYEYNFKTTLTKRNANMKVINP